MPPKDSAWWSWSNKEWTNAKFTILGEQKMANRSQPEVRLTAVNNGYMVTDENSGEVWVYEDVDDALKQAREILETANETDDTGT